MGGKQYTVTPSFTSEQLRRIVLLDRCVLRRIRAGQRHCILSWRGGQAGAAKRVPGMISCRSVACWGGCAGGRHRG
eukprot:365781-Chlamydomonas_euryale.AAC.5